MKKILFMLVAFSIFACNNKAEEEKKGNLEEKNTATTPTLAYNTNLNKLVKDTIDGGMMLLGSIDKEGLSNKIFKEWYKENHYAHDLDTITIKKLKPLLEEVSIKVFIGTWCSDSQREIPALYKILSEASYDIKLVEMYAVNHDKETPDHLEKGMNIEYVPTIIFYEEEKEIGRYVEFAQENLEKDMLAILNKSGYKHSYEE